LRKRKTAGALSLQASRDLTKYDPLEIGHALTEDVVEQIRICGERHEKIFNETEYCVILVVASDPLIKGVRRHKYAAFLYLPMPRPQQSVFLYNKISKSLKRLWSMPDARVMATITDLPTVAKKWQETQGWCKAFYHGWKYSKEQDKWINTTPSYFFDYIRHQHSIKMPSETEYLNANREKLIEAGCKDFPTGLTEAFDFSKVAVNKVIDPNNSVVE